MCNTPLNTKTTAVASIQTTNNANNTAEVTDHAPMIDQATAIGWDVSQSEWDSRKVRGVCQWCGSDSHRACGDCQFWHADHPSQKFALGGDARGYKRLRRKKLGLCSYCGHGHKRNVCSKAAHAEEAAINAKVLSSQGPSKAERRRNYEKTLAE